MNTTRTLAAALLAASALIQPAAAAQFTRSADHSGHLYLTGTIKEGDDARFIAALDDSVEVVSLTSEGGYVREAMNIGRAIKQRGLATEISAGYRCASSCALIWSAGRPRRVAGELIFHCARDPSEQSCSEPGRRAMVAYLRAMDVPERLVSLQEAAGLSIGLWAKAEDLAEPVPLPRERPIVVAQVADGRDGYRDPDEPPEQWQDAPRRYPQPRRYYAPEPYPPPPPPGWLYGPGGRLIPCALWLLGICI
jgi:hypothetical protein